VLGVLGVLGDIILSVEGGSSSDIIGVRIARSGGSVSFSRGGLGEHVERFEELASAVVDGHLLRALSQETELNTD